MPRAAKKKTTSKRKVTVKKSVTASVNDLSTKKPLKHKKLFKYWLIGLVVVVILGLAYLGKGLVIAAMVNGRPVSRLAVIQNLEKSGGKAALDNMITEELISQEAKKKNIVITDSDVQTEIDNLTKTVQAQGTTLDAALATRGMTLDDLKKNIKLQKTVEAILAPQLAVTDDDVKKYFDDNKDVYGANAKYDDVKDTVKSDLQQEKFSTEFQKWYQQLQSQSDIKYFVSY